MEICRLLSAQAGGGSGRDSAQPGLILCIPRLPGASLFEVEEAGGGSGHFLRGHPVRKVVFCTRGEGDPAITCSIGFTLKGGGDDFICHTFRFADEAGAEAYLGHWGTCPECYR